VGPKKRIIVELTPAAIDGAVISCGRVVRSAHLDIEPTDWRQAWEEGLSPFDGKLSELIEALDAPGARVDVAYQSPTSFAEVIVVPVTGSAVVGAATLALADHVGFDLGTNPYDACPISTTTINGAKATYTLVIADESRASETLFAWLGRAGLHPASACPASALTLCDAVEEARRERHESISARLFVDRHCALLTVASGGSVRQVRRIEIGFEDFVTAITRPILRRDASAEPVSLTPSRAREILCDSGIPGFKTTIDETLGLTGKDVLPLIQPALQRLAIEIKQSLRFELSEDERASIKLTLTGPFGAMPGLGSAICDQIEIVEGGSRAGKFGRASVREPFMGEPARAKRLACLTSAHSLVSEQIKSEQRVESFRVGLRAGVALAVIALVASAFFMNAQIRGQRDASKNLGAAMGVVDQIIGINEQIQARSDTLAATRQRMDVAIGLTTHWSDVLAALPGLVPDSVVLADIEGTERSERMPPRLELTGIARNHDEQTCQSALNEFIESLNACPLVTSVDLGVTNRLSADETTEAIRFSVIVNLVPTPRLAIAEPDGGPTP